MARHRRESGEGPLALAMILLGTILRHRSVAAGKTADRAGHGVNRAGDHGPWSATAVTLMLVNLTATNAGAYRVVVTNAAGSATSAAADLYFHGDLKLLAATVLDGSVGRQDRGEYVDVVRPPARRTGWCSPTSRCRAARIW